MVKIWKLLLAVMATAVLAGCAGPLKQKFEPDNKVCGASPCAALGTIYTTSYFQERFLLRHIAGQVVGGAIGGAIAATAPGAQPPQTNPRLEVNDFEKNLGAFDTTQYFSQALQNRLGTLPQLGIKFVEDSTAKEQIQAQVRATSGWAPHVVDPKTGDKLANVAAFRVKYGMGARVGNEQLGFRKSYRPFVQVVGQVRNLPTGKLAWADMVLVFGPQRFVGSAADADRVNTDELRTTLQALCQEAAALLVKSLSGEQLPEMPEIVDANTTDWEF